MSSEVTRREAFKVLAIGAAGAAAGAGEALAAPAGPGAARGRSSGLREVTEATTRMEGEPAIPERNPPCLATVLRVRSWSRQAYLHVSDEVRGFVALPPEGLAIAAACQAAGRPAAVRYWGHDPSWNGGAGRFEGAVLAVDPQDLPGQPAVDLG
jgi:hypothetical protein